MSKPWQALSVFPILIAAIVALERRDWTDPARTETQAFDVRGILGAVLTPKNFSSFGLVRRQKGATKTVVLMILTRLVCGILLVVILQGRDCHIDHDRYQCNMNPNLCDRTPGNQSVMYFCDCSTKQGWQTQGQDDWRCRSVVDLRRWNKDRIHPRTGRVGHYEDLLRGAEVGPFCNSGHMSLYYNTAMSPVFNCSLISLQGTIPRMLEQSCEAREFEVVKFHMCRQASAAIFSGVCDGRFTLCVAVNGDMHEQKIRMLAYLFLPMSALVALILVHGVACLLKSCLTGAEENTEMRKRVRQQAKLYQQQLESGTLDHSLLRLGTWMIIPQFVCASPCNTLTTHLSAPLSGITAPVRKSSC